MNYGLVPVMNMPGVIHQNTIRNFFVSMIICEVARSTLWRKLLEERILL